MSTNVVRLEELGHGATGCVYKAVHATSLQLLAVKEVTLTADGVNENRPPIIHKRC